MTTYNKNKTAYRCSGDWFLIPRGRTRAPRNKYNLSLILWEDYGRTVHEECLQALDENDRNLLLDAYDEGCFSLVRHELMQDLSRRRMVNGRRLLAANGYNLEDVQRIQGEGKR